MLTAASPATTSFAQPAQAAPLNRKAGTDAVTAGTRQDTVKLSNEARQLAELKSRDHAVRAHEAAHQAVGGRLVQGAATYTYQLGPDGARYAIGGEVSIDVSPGATPEETLAKANQIRAAALAPADPSSQDLLVAANATIMAAEARAELAGRQAARYRADTVSNVGKAVDAFA